MASGTNNPNGIGMDQSSQANQIIHIRENSDSELQALFDSVLQPNPSRRQNIIPLRSRNLPASFFNPPSTGSKSPSVSVSHSRENSVDSTLNVLRRSPLPNSANGMGLGGHLRAHSSPASLEQTYSMANVQQTHIGQPLGSAPPQSGSSGNLTDDPLPPGWEQAQTSEGQIYFINHIMKSTTWEDPRKAQRQQILAAVGDGVGSAGTQSQEQSNNAGLTPAMLQGPTRAVGPLPEGWEQAISAEGEIYFINHRTRTTSWFDPRLPSHLQRPPVLHQQLIAAAMAQATANGAGATPNSGNTPFLNQQAMQGSRLREERLQQLQLEREALIMRQQEIKLQMEQEKAQLRQTRLGQVKMEDGVELDPFLGGSMANPSTPGSNSDYHSRQESADSGLGMGTYPSVPNTPEDFLSTMDDNMDTISENGLGVGASLDTSDIVSLGNENVESTDDLVPSLQLSEELSNELLDEMQSIINSKTDNTMTWL